MAVSSIITYHPFKALVALVAVLINAVKLPIWLLWYIPRAGRQHPQFTYVQAIKTQILKTALWYFSFVRIYTPLKIKASTRNAGKFVTIPPSNDANVYTGVCKDKEIKPQTISGYWYPSAYDVKADKGRKAILHFHGGAFVIGDSNDREAVFGGSVIGKHIGKNMWVAYRLSSNPGGRFPAALQDAITAYKYFLDKGIPANDIVFGGDSAGGNLVVALLRYIATTNGVLPSPYAALIWSPWVDVSLPMDQTLIYQSPRFVTDYLVANFPYWGATTYAPADGPVHVTSEWVSPKAHPFKLPAPLWIQACGQEVLYDDDKEFMENMKSVEGNVVGWHVEEMGNHDIILTGKITGFTKEANHAAIQARKWLNSLKKIQA